MSSYSFSSAQRFAVFTTHGEKCYSCGGPVDFATMEVDHIIPESLLKEPDKLRMVLKSLGRPDNFCINSFANWMPICRRCNRTKSDIVFEPTPLIQIYLQQAAEKAVQAEALAKETVNNRKIDNAFHIIERAHSDGALTEEMRLALRPFVYLTEKRRAPEQISKPIRITPLYEVLSEKGGVRVIRGPYGIGGGPIGPHIDSSFYCSNCGAAAWNGARCVVCGQMDDD